MPHLDVILDYAGVNARRENRKKGKNSNFARMAYNGRMRKAARKSLGAALSENLHMI